MKKIVLKHPIKAKDKKKVYKKGQIVKKVVVYPDKTEYYVEKEAVENEANKRAVSKRK